MEQLFVGQINIWLLLVLVLWVLPWKGWALWLAARNSHKIWFIVLLVLNTLAIVDIIYIFFVAKKYGPHRPFDKSVDKEAGGYSQSEE